MHYGQLLIVLCTRGCSVPQSQSWRLTGTCARMCRLMRELKDFSSRRWETVLHWSLGFCTVSSP